MSVIKLPWRSEPDDYPDPQMPPVVTERLAVVEFGEKPADLVEAAQTHEWTRRGHNERKQADSFVAAEPTKETLHSVPWQNTPPTQTGIWWWASAESKTVQLCTVLRMGRGLCVRKAWPDGAVWTSVEALRGRWWAGPIPGPAHMSLEDFANG